MGFRVVGSLGLCFQGLGCKAYGLGHLGFGLVDLRALGI